MQKRHIIPTLALAVLLVGCATTTANLSQAPVAAYRDSIDLSGRLSVTYHKDGQPQNLIGNFEWIQRPGRVDVSLSSQLGQTVAALSVTPQEATLKQAGREPVVARDVDSLTARALGWSLPVAGLRDWMQGYATDASGKRFVASPAANSVFTQDGWRLRFAEWQNESAAHPVPSVIIAERSATPTSEEMQIRIAIDPVT
jgi:outer membrane lipoprotein LolB